MARLRDVWDTARRGTPRLAVVTGEAGAGKTTLTGHFAASVQREGATVLWGRAAHETLVPFEALVQALRTALHALSPRARERVIAERGAMTVLLPELPQLVPTLRAERPSPDVERYLLFETVADLLVVESAVAPILLVVDDVQWADAPTIKLLEHVLRHEGRSRVMVLVTQRVPSEDPHPDLDRLLMSLARDSELTRLDVGALDDEAVGDLLELAERPRGGAAELRAVTGGNAFFVSEVIASGMGRDGTGTEVPDSIRAMLAARLDRLPAASVNVVSLAAVAGPLSTLPVLVAATELDADEVLDAVDVAVAAGLLQEDGAGRLVTPHALVRNAVVGRLSASRRQDMHRRIAAALRHAAGAEVASAELAHHLLAAGSLAPRAERLAAALAAGEEALERVAYEEAAAWVERARALVGSDGTSDGAGLEILDSASRRVLGDREGAQAAARRATRAAIAAGDPILRARAVEQWVMSVAGLGFDSGQTGDPELIAELDAAIAALPADAVDHQVWLRSMLVSVLVESGQFERQARLSEEAMALAAQANAPHLIASALYAHRLALWRRDRLAERLPVALRAIEAARRAGDVHLELSSMLVAQTDYMESGQVAEQLAMLEEFERRAATQRSPLYDVYGSFLRSCRLLVTGQYDAAEQLANEALAAGLASHGSSTQMAHAGQMFCIAWDRGQLGDIVDFVEPLAASSPSTPIWRVALVGSLIAAGRVEEAQRTFDELVTADGVKVPDDSLYFTSACFLVEAARALGDRGGASALRRTLEPYANRIAITGLGGVGIGPVCRYVGIAAHVEGDLDAAVEHLGAAVEASSRHGMRPFTARAHRDLALALTDRDGPGDAAAAAEHRAQADALAAEIGLVLGLP
jgi:tetratricopeptide (TPR) repeat protein